MERLLESGKVKAIGVSNFLEHHLEPLVEEAVVPPMVNQAVFATVHPRLSPQPQP